MKTYCEITENHQKSAIDEHIAKYSNWLLKKFFNDLEELLELLCLHQHSQQINRALVSCADGAGKRPPPHVGLGERSPVHTYVRHSQLRSHS